LENINSKMIQYFDGLKKSGFFSYTWASIFIY
jgi:hypothetical protein